MTIGVKIKICGITRPENAAMVVARGADYVGLNFWPQSKRYLAPDKAAEVAAAARGGGAVKIVGVFADATMDEIAAVRAQVELDAIQLHGDETPEFANQVSAATEVEVWKAIAGTAADA